jgi:excisionase family DNA binding protein
MQKTAALHSLAEGSAAALNKEKACSMSSKPPSASNIKAADYVPAGKADARAYADFAMENFERWEWPLAKRRRKKRSDGLLTIDEAAAYLHITDEQLGSFVKQGAIQYVNVGRGKLRPRIRFTSSDLDAFIERRRQQEAPCLSTESRTARSSISTSSSNVIGFTALRNARLAAKLKPSKR